MKKPVTFLWRYGIAIAVVLLVVALRLTLNPFLEENAPLLFFTLAVMFAAWFGRFFAGALATFLSALLGVYLFIEPHYSFYINNRNDFVSIISFVIIGITVSFLMEQLQGAKEQAEAKTAEVERESAVRLAAQNAARESENRFRYVADAAPVLIWTAGTDKRLDWANRAWLEFTGRTMEQEVGKPWFEGVHPQDLERCSNLYLESFAAREAFSMEYRLRRRDGEYRWLLDTAAPRFTPDNEFAGYIGSCVDITERKESEQERERLLAAARRAHAQVEQASRMKDEFLATVSHELRTPLNAILGWTQMLTTGIVGDNQIPKAIQTIERNARSQAQLIEDLLDVTRITSGKLRLNIKQANLDSVVEAALDTVRPAAEAREIRIETELDDLPHIVSGDPERLQQVVWNLLSNAIKFTPKGGRVSVKLERRESAAQITVSDTGKGIEPEFLPYVFERFRQQDGKTTRKFGGLGLGLAIVRHIVELHGGVVSAESAGEGAGATFTVRLPIRVIAESKLTNGTGKLKLPVDSADEPPEFSLDLTGLKIVVVDDEPDARELLRTLLTKYGADVAACESAAEAFAELRRRQPHLLVSDIGLPDEDGFSLIQKVRALAPAEGGQTPAIALTAFARVEDRLRALSHGFQMFVPKPVEPSELVAAIRSLAAMRENFQK